MCFRFDACFGAVPYPDDCGGAAKGVPPPRHHYHAAPVKTTTAPHHPLPTAAQRYGHHYGVAHHGNGYRAPPHHHHHQLPADEEGDRKASNDLRKGHAPAAGATTTMEGRHGYAAGAAYVYSGARDMMVMQAPRNARVVSGDDGCHGAHYHFHEREPAHGEDAGDHHYSTSTASIAHHGSY